MIYATFSRRCRPTGVFYCLDSAVYHARQAGEFVVLLDPFTIVRDYRRTV